LPAHHEASLHGEPAILFLRPLRASRSSHRRYDLPQVEHIAQDLVPRHSFDGLYGRRSLRKTNRKGDRRYVQNGVAHVQAHSYAFRRRSGYRAARDAGTRNRPQRSKSFLREVSIRTATRGSRILIRREIGVGHFSASQKFCKAPLRAFASLLSSLQKTIVFVKAASSAAIGRSRSLIRCINIAFMISWSGLTGL